MTTGDDINLEQLQGGLNVVSEKYSHTDLWIQPLAIKMAENGKASSASKFPFHNWYYFVLGYTPEFPDYILAREKADSSYFTNFGKIKGS